RLCAHPKSIAKLKAKLKVLTGRSNGMGYERRKRELHQMIRGWVGYFKLADMKSTLEAIDKWLRRRVRMCIWKAWKRPETRVTNLIKCGIKPYWARIYGNSSKGYWANAEGIMHHAAGNDKLRRAGYPCLMDYYVQLHRK
ncbi:MAG: group II intron reverse transcriptase/maturase, partial [Bacteroidales bacterium]|nr:group II intron reverse transcriptase/maturase [Bacteroidales bacterium]